MSASKARRRVLRNLRNFARRAALAGLSLAGGPALAETIVAASYSEPTTRYAHGILGDAIEFGTLEIVTEGDGTKKNYVIKLPQTRVFEDVEPRLWDITGDGAPEVVVIESDARLGAQLAVYDQTGKIAATPHIGRANRWLAPIGAADMDGDGAIEIGFIDRPHLARTLRVWRYEGGDLVPVAELVGLTNHRIGERDIGGGLRDCGDGPEMITASANWNRVMATRLQSGTLETRDIGPHTGRASLNAALRCE